jgi:hypothetical protein
MHPILFVDDEPGVLAGLRRMLRARREGWDSRVNRPKPANRDAESLADLLICSVRPQGLEP